MGDSPAAEPWNPEPLNTPPRFPPPIPPARAMEGPAVAPVVQAWTARPTAAPTGFMVAPGQTHENPQFYARDLVATGEADVYGEELVWSDHGGNGIPGGMGGGGDTMYNTRALILSPIGSCGTLLRNTEFPWPAQF